VAGQERKKGRRKEEIEENSRERGKKSKNGVEQPRDFQTFRGERQLQGDRSGEDKGTEERRKSR
jgi:hypothetical protein